MAPDTVSSGNMMRGTVEASPAQAKGMVEMYREMAKAGIPLSSDLTIDFEYRKAGR